MSEEIVKPIDTDAHNAEIAQKLAAQDVLGQSTAAKDTGDVGDALDALQKQAEEDAKKKAEAEAAEKAAPAKTDAEVAAEKEAADKAKADADALEAEKKRAEELFKDSPQLPPGASPKSSESFAAIKIKAAQEISKLQSELEKLKKDNAEAAEKLKNVAPPEAIKELEDHRAWRAKLDVEADPKWKEFDKQVATTREFIYAQLSRSPAITKEVLDEIKKHGGPENVQMDRIYAAIKDPALQRTVESKIADIEQRKFEKGQAIEAAKSNLNEYVTSRAKAAEEALVNHNTATEKHFQEITSKLDWYKEKAVDPKAAEADRKAAEAHNAFVAQTKQQLKVAMTDDSPEMRAIMLAGMAQLFRLQTVHGGVVSELEALKKSNTELQAKFDKLKSGSVTRLRESNANPNAKPPEVKKDDITVSAGDALDNLRKQVTEERERAAAAGK